MHKLFLSIALVASTMFGVIIAAHASPPHVIHASMIWLLTDAQAYAGKEIQVSGYLSVEFEDTRLYLNCASYRYLESTNSITVSLDDDSYEKLKKLQGSYVSAVGRFQSSPHYGSSPVSEPAGILTVENYQGEPNITKLHPRVDVASLQRCGVGQSGNNGLSPKLAAHVVLGTSRWSKFIRVLQKFSKREGFSITHEKGVREKNTIRSVNMILIRKDEVSIVVLSDDIDKNGVNIFVYTKGKGDKWKLPAERLVSVLRGHWPKAVSITYSAKDIHSSK